MKVPFFAKYSMEKHGMKTNLKENNTEFFFESEDTVDIQIKNIPDENVELYKIIFDWNEKKTPKEIRLSFFNPCTDAYTHWDVKNHTPRFFAWHRDKSTESRLAKWMPITQLAAKSGKNSYTVALSDVKTPTKIAVTYHLYNKKAETYIAFFTSPIEPISHYEVTIRIDKRNIPYDKAIISARYWYSEMGYKNDHIPEAAKDSVYSTWYAYLQDVKAKDVLKECKIAKKLGMDTVIVDDGWQNKEILRDYSNCGDWIPAKNRFPDMRKFSDEIHALGMKFMLWFSVPFIGWDAKNFKKFEGKYLHEVHGIKANILDPRYPEVRRFLVDTYKKAVTEWNLDGLKLDFIDRFQANDIVNEEMDFHSVEDATESLLKEISTELRAINNDILIEFRQPYMGPVITTYGNMIRVWDCPNDSFTNRISITDLRLTAGKTVVHGDMIVWNNEDSNEGVAAQLYSSLFAVPQISVKLNKISPEHKKVLSEFLKFRNAHKKTIMDGEFTAKGPEANYSYTETVLNGERVSLSITTPVIKLREDITTDCFVNLSEETVVPVTGDKTDRKYEITDCTGKILAKRKFKKNDQFVTVPYCGKIRIYK